MHELSATQGILDTVLSHARGNDVTKVIRIHLAIGELSDMNEEWLQRYFSYLSRDTVASEARICVHRVPVGFRCYDCAIDFDVDLKTVDRVRCPKCSGDNCSLERGREFFIRDMEVV